MEKTFGENAQKLSLEKSRINKMDWEIYKVDVPVGEQGQTKVQKLIITEAAAMTHNWRESTKGRNRDISSGEYTQLITNGHLWMSDTPAEICDHYALFRNVSVWSGTVLLHGLGLGMALNGCFLNHARHITVVEHNKDVIDLVMPHWINKWGEDKIEVIHDDALIWKPQRKKHWDIVWHDIWSNICPDNLEEVTKLHRRFSQRSNWQDSWGRSACMHTRKIERRQRIKVPWIYTY